MRIACVKCSTLYELDDRLIPPSGAPVQCTRCGSVFTAKAGDAGKQMPAAAQPSPVAVPPSAVAPRRSATQIFGAIKTEPPMPAGGARAATQVFGAPRASSQRSPASSVQGLLEFTEPTRD